MSDLVILSSDWLSNSDSNFSLFGDWHFNKSSGDVAVDSSIYLRDATLLNMNNDVWVEGKVGNCLSFDGVDDYVEITGYTGIGGGSSRTVCAWIKTFDTSGEIVSWGATAIPGGRWIFVTQADGFLRLEVGGGAIVGRTIICDDQWHHVAAVLENDGSPNVNEIRLYVDGVEDVSATFPHEKGVDLVGLELINGTIYDGLWKGEWNVHDTIDKKYVTELTVTDINGNDDSKEIEWKQDKCPWNEAESTKEHKCAVKNISICPYFKGVEYEDKVLCTYPEKNE